MTSRYYVRSLGCLLLSYALTHIWGFLTVGFYSFDLNAVLVLGVYLCHVLKIFHHIYIHCRCYLQYRWGGWSDIIWGSCSVCSGGVWRMVLSVGRGKVVDNNGLNFFFFYLLFQQILYILRDMLLYKFSSSYIEQCTWCSHSSVWIHDFRRVFNIMLGTSPFAWTHLNFHSVDIRVKPG